MMGSKVLSVSWMMLICLEDHATARAGMAHHAPGTAAQRWKFHSAISPIIAHRSLLRCQTEAGIDMNSVARRG